MRIVQTPYLPLIWLAIIIYSSKAESSQVVVGKILYICCPNNFIGYGLTDLYGSDDNTFFPMADLWNINGATGQGAVVTTFCDSNIIGRSTFPLNGYIQRTYTNLATPHSIIWYSARVYAIDNWLPGDTISMYLDGTLVQTWQPYNTILAEGSAICGSSSYSDSFVFFSGKFLHTAPDITLKLMYSISSSSATAYIGIRGVRMVFGNTMTGDTQSACIRMQNGATPGGCSCPNSQGIDPSNPTQCIACNAACTQCDSPLTNQCYGCSNGYSFNGINCIACESNCRFCIGVGPKQCQVCNSAYVLFWDNTCHLPASCLYPYILQATGDYKTCKSPCLSTQYLLYDNTCATSCSSPFNVRIEGTTKFCDFPCTPSNYLYWDGTCLPSCSYYIRTVSSFRFCDACQPGYYMYSNGTCIASCMSPRTQATLMNSQFCNDPCPGTSKYHYPHDASCRSVCDSSFIFFDSIICIFPCPSGQYLAWDNTCSTSCSSPYTTRSEGTALFCDFPCTSSSYLYWDSTCLTVCPYYTRAVSGYQFCDACQPGYHMYSNGTCIASCASPRTQVTLMSSQFCNDPCPTASKYYYTHDSSCRATCDSSFILFDSIVCIFPCASGQYLVWSNTCSTSCSSPYIIRSESTALFCDFPCTSSSYLYWDSTCLTACPYYTRAVSGYQFCDACQPGYYMYSNGTCIASCISPRTQVTLMNSQFCNDPCPGTSKYYYTHDSSCRATCDSSFILFDSIICIFPCPSGQYLAWDNTCSTSCSSPYTTRSEGTALFCDFPCASSSYLYWDSTCLTVCPYYTRTVSGYQFCDACQPDYYMHSNNTCLTSCIPPRTKVTLINSQFCNDPCPSVSKYYYTNDTICRSTCDSPNIITDQIICNTNPCPANQYLLSNNTCAISCDPPFHIRTTSTITFCDFPCISSQFLYWNGTCLSSCLFFPRIVGTYQYCDACQAGLYMYSNSTCIASCSSPRKQRTLMNSQFCDNPCPSSSKYYYTSDNTCKSTCNNPYFVFDDVICILGLSQEEVKQAQTISGVLSVTGSTTSNVGTAASLINFNNPTGLCLAGLSDMLNYVKYMNISYSPKLQYVLDANSPSLNLLPDLPDKIVNSFPTHRLAYGFEKYQLSSSFLVNFWTPALTLSIVAFAAFLVSYIEPWTLAYRKVYMISRKIRESLRWNFFISLFTSYYGNIALFSSFELRKAEMGSFQGAFSFLVCIFVNIIVLVVYVRMISVIFILRRYGRVQNNMDTTDLSPIAVDRFREYKSIFQNYKTRTFAQQAFLSLFVGRIYLFNTILAYFFNYPLLQISLITFMSIAMSLYLIIARPLKGRLELGQYIVQELSLLVVNTCIFVLAVLDHKNIEAVESRKTIGNLIVGLNMGFTILSSVYLIVSTLLELREIYLRVKRFYKDRKANSKKADLTNTIDDKTARNSTVSSDFIKLTSQEMSTSRALHSGSHIEIESVYPISQPISRQSSADSYVGNKKDLRSNADNSSPDLIRKSGSLSPIEIDTNVDKHLELVDSMYNANNINPKLFRRVRGRVVPDYSDTLKERIEKESPELSGQKKADDFESPLKKRRNAD